MNRLFNTVFENSLRMLLLLNLYEMPQTLDMLYAVDFMTQYGKTFGITNEELNGSNPFKFSEFTGRRDLVKESLRQLVLKGLVQPVETSKGMSYVISSEGEEYCAMLDSEFAMKYKEYASKTIAMIGNKSERQIISQIIFLLRFSNHRSEHRTGPAVKHIL